MMCIFCPTNSFASYCWTVLERMSNQSVRKTSENTLKNETQSKKKSFPSVFGHSNAPIKYIVREYKRPFNLRKYLQPYIVANCQ